jgi:hypothetical protein
VTSIALRTIFVSPAIAAALPRGVSVGVAVNVIWGDLALDQRNAIPSHGDPEQYPDPGSELELDAPRRPRPVQPSGATIGLGWHSPDDRIRIGASVMTPVTPPPPRGSTRARSRSS